MEFQEYRKYIAIAFSIRKYSHEVTLLYKQIISHITQTYIHDELTRNELGI